MTGALVFAQRLLARWDVRVLAPGPLGLVLRVPGRATRTGARAPLVFAPVRFELRPRIELALVRPPAARVERAPGAPGDERPAQAGAEPLVLRARAAIATERLFERLSARSTRVERTVHVASPAAEPAVRGPIPQLPGRRLDLVVRTTPPVADTRAPERPHAESAAAASRWGPGAAAAESSAGAALPEADVARLADSVIATLDRRLIAYAERTGAR